MHNLALVEEGYARALLIHPNLRYAHRFLAAERGAEQRRAGVSGECERRRRSARARARRARLEAAAERRELAAARRRLRARRRAASRRRAAARREERRAQRSLDYGGSGSSSDEHRLRRRKRTDPNPARRPQQP
jgi:hypothetical protein